MRRLAAGAVLLGLATVAPARQPVERAPDVEPTRCAIGATPDYVPRLLRITVNGSDTPLEPLLLQRPCGALLARLADLAALRIKTAGKPTVLIDGEPYLNLNDYEGLHFVLAESAQRLAIEGEPWIFHPTVFDLQPRVADAPAPTPFGAFLNYGVFANGAAEQDPTALSTSAGIGLFEGERVLLGDWMYFRQSGIERIHRLDTTLVQDYPDRVATLRVGDVHARGGAYGGGAAIGGVQYGTNFGTRPGMTIAPVQVLEAATRQTAGVNLYINPQDPERASRAAFLGSLTTVPHGPVELINVPTYNNGEYELLLRDALGREVLVRQPFYFNAGLLREGLHDFSYEAGAPRLGFGGDRYGGLLLSGTHRYGFTGRFTGEAHAALGERGGAGGLTALWSVPRVGVLGATAAASRSDLSPGIGALAGLSLENRYEHYGYALRHDCQTAEFALPAADALPAATPVCRSALGVSSTLGRFGSLGLTAAMGRVRGDDGTRSLRLGYTLRPWPGAHLTTYAGWSRAGDEDVSAGVVFSTSLAPIAATRFGRGGLIDTRRTQVSASAVADGDGVTRSLGRLSTSARVGETALGMQASSSLSGPEERSLTVSAAGPVLNTVGGVHSVEGLERYSAGATGAIAWLDGRWKPTRPLYSSFALVRLGAENAGVRVNGLRADAQGDVLVAPLQAYADNAVALNGADLPMNARFDALSQTVTPRWRSGVVVRPRIEHVRDAMLTVLMRDAAGLPAPVPTGAYAMLPRSSERFPAGEDGAIYVSGLAAATPVTVHYRGASCTLEVRLPEQTPRDEIPELGPYLCEATP